MRNTPFKHNLTSMQELEVKISEARAPIEALEEENRKTQNEMNIKISEMQRVTQDLNLNADKLSVINKTVER